MKIFALIKKELFNVVFIMLMVCICMAKCDKVEASTYGDFEYEKTIDLYDGHEYVYIKGYTGTFCYQHESFAE